MFNKKLKTLLLADIHNLTYIHLICGMENILLLPNPDDFICDVVEYQRGHRSINIKIFEKQAPEKYFYLYAQNIFYFSGRFYWMGANFKAFIPEETLNLVRKFPEFNRWNDNMLKDLFLTISVVNSPEEITICASNYGLLIDKYLPEFIDKK